MKDSTKNSFLATINAPADSLLLGPHQWTVFNDSINCHPDTNSGNSYTVTLSLTGCNTSNQFTCGDGVCISLDQKCDGLNDCNDESDERSCTTLRLPEGYRRQMVPQTCKDSKLDVNVSLSIDGFLEVNEVEQFIKIQFTLSYTWFDKRLSYKNLQNNSRLNGISNNNGLWRPDLKFVNIDRTKRSDKSHVGHRVIRNKQSQPTLEKISKLHNAYIFNGSENTLQRTAFYTYAWNCAYDFSLYPFDTQHCTMNIGLRDEDILYLNPNPVRIEHKGSKDELAQYTIEKISFCSGKGKHSLLVHIVLGRPLISSMLTVFIPTLLLLIISQLARVFVDDFIDMVIQVHLTLLLVLASL